MGEDRAALLKVCAQKSEQYIAERKAHEMTRRERDDAIAREVVLRSNIKDVSVEYPEGRSGSSSDTCAFWAGVYEYQKAIKSAIAAPSPQARVILAEIRRLRIVAGMDNRKFDPEGK